MLRVFFVLVAWMIFGAGTCARAQERTPAPPSAEKCSMIQSAIEQFGEALVLSAARARGYTEAEIHSFRRACLRESRR